MPTFDLKIALDQVDGDKDTLSLLVSTFRRVSPKQFEEMTRAIDDADASKLGATAHCLKGSLGVFAAESAAALARQIENCARHGDFVTAKDALSELEIEHARLQAELATFFDSAD